MDFLFFGILINFRLVIISSMSNFKLDFGITDSLFEDHLTAIKGISFTLREIEIIACILHNRGEKKIAALFLISPRTISAHVYNIMNKIGCNSKDQIIDFIETSGKLPVLKEYYLHLLVKSYFEKFLSKIAATINRKLVKCSCNLEDMLDADKKLLQSIKKHLKLANIEVNETHDKQIDENQIFLDLMHVKEDTYYHDMILIISNVIKSEELNKLIEEFTRLYKEISEGEKENIVYVHKSAKHTNLIKIFGTIFTFIILLGFSMYCYQSYKLPSAVENINSKPKIISQLEIFLDSIKNEGFTANNASKSESKINQSLIKKVEHILDYQNTTEVQKYFDRTDIDSKFLLSYIYHLYSLSSYYMYNMHDGRKAREILLYSKNLIENYLNSRSRVVIKFDNISSDELCAEVDTIKDLPQIYTRIIYGIGRSYIYQDGEENGIRYFEIAKYLGNKLGLFEGYLSEVSGILPIKKKNIATGIQENKKDAKQGLNDLISSYNRLKNENRIFILDFVPNKLDQKTIIPSEDLYNIFTNQTRIIECYKDLLLIAEAKTERKDIINSISWILYNDFVGTTQSMLQANEKGIKYIFDKIPLRRLASLYNVLGDIFLILFQKHEDGTILRAPILQAQILGELLSDSSVNIDLEIAHSLFDKARSISRNTDFTKADAYEGLIKVYKEKLGARNLTAKEKNDLNIKIKELTDKNSEINSYLGR